MHYSTIRSDNVHKYALVLNAKSRIFLYLYSMFIARDIYIKDLNAKRFFLYTVCQEFNPAIFMRGEKGKSYKFRMVTYVKGNVRNLT